MLHKSNDPKVRALFRTYEVPMGIELRQIQLKKYLLIREWNYPYNIELQVVDK